MAVMGYKCRSMQLQGELEDARAKLRDMTSSSSSSSSASAQQLGSLSAAAATTATPNNAHLSSEIERLREELKQKQAVVDRLTSGDSSSYIRVGVGVCVGGGVSVCVCEYVKVVICMYM